MDEMKIESKLLRSIVSKLIKKELKKKIGYDIDIQINEVEAAYNGEKLHAHLSVDEDLDNED